MNIKRFFFNSFHECCILLWDDAGAAVIVDPGCISPEETAELTGFVQAHGLHPEKILLTHGHFDHIHGVASLAKIYGIPVLMHPADRTIVENADYFCNRFGIPVPDSSFGTEDIADGDVIKAGTMTFEVLSTPGHTPGGVCYLCREDKLLLSGDTLFAGSIGRTDNGWGDYDALIAGIFEKLMTLDGDIRVIPGHGPATDIATERMTNPFLQPFNQPFETEGY